jgi:1,2-diacylglycerol 3-alpha-glucosyltransferase
LKKINNKPLVFIVCTGLGNINRGYESFTRECFNALKDIATFDLFLIKGAGRKNKNEIVIPNFKRRGLAARLLGKWFRTNAYYIEQVSFCICLIPYILKKKPSLIYYSDFALGSLLWHIRKRLKFQYKLLFANGAPNGPPYKTEDHVQQLLPVYYSIGIKSDGISDKHTLVPYAFDIDLEKRTNSIGRREQIRKELGFCATQKVVLTVGAVNNSHKRIEYIINELAGLSENYFLIVLGQFEDETPALMQTAERELPGRHIIKNIPHSEVEKYYAAADYFVLASLQEGFPRVTIEALSFGLPCIVQDNIINRQVLQQWGVFIDMRFEGELAVCLQTINADNFCKDELMRNAYNCYSWNVLKHKYADMLLRQVDFNNTYAGV